MSVAITMRARLGGGSSAGPPGTALFVERVDPFRESEVELRQSTFAVRREDEPHFVVADIDVGMVLFVLRNFGDGVHKIDRIGEIIELKRPFDVLLFELPLRDFFQPVLELVRFDQVSHIGVTRSTPKLDCNRDSASFLAARRKIFGPSFRSENQTHIPRKITLAGAIDAPVILR